uniref:Uncharacterized protein n=1 Tax=Tanacetum cinerariifolium TaxID=118510 RepID=A0A6L2NBY2_TANCI|nr:hypothetical protein [Tanacetum cinerariifolium]
MIGRVCHDLGLLLIYSFFVNFNGSTTHRHTHEVKIWSLTLGFSGLKIMLQKRTKGITAMAQTKELNNEILGRTINEDLLLAGIVYVDNHVPQ